MALAVHLLRRGGAGMQAPYVAFFPRQRASDALHVQAGQLSAGRSGQNVTVPVVWPGSPGHRDCNRCNTVHFLAYVFMAAHPAHTCTPSERPSPKDSEIKTINMKQHKIDSELHTVML